MLSASWYSSAARSVPAVGDVGTRRGVGEGGRAVKPTAAPSAAAITTIPARAAMILDEPPVRFGVIVVGSPATETGL